MRSGACRAATGLQTYADVMEDEGRTILNQLLDSGEDVAAEVAWLLSGLADAGDEWAATALEQLVDSLPADVAASVAAKASEFPRTHFVEA